MLNSMLLSQLGMFQTKSTTVERPVLLRPIQLLENATWTNYDALLCVLSWFIFMYPASSSSLQSVLQSSDMKKKFIADTLSTNKHTLAQPLPTHTAAQPIVSSPRLSHEKKEIY